MSNVISVVFFFFFPPKTRSVVILAFQGCLFLLRRLPHIMYQFSQGPRGCVVSGPLGNPTVGDETKSFDLGKNPSSFKEIIMCVKYAVLQWVVHSVNLSFVTLFERTITSFWEISCFSTGSFYTDHSQHYQGSYLQEAAGWRESPSGIWGAKPSRQTPNKGKTIPSTKMLSLYLRIDDPLTFPSLGSYWFGAAPSSQLRVQQVPTGVPFSDLAPWLISALLLQLPAPAALLVGFCGALQCKITVTVWVKKKRQQWYT